MNLTTICTMCVAHNIAANGTDANEVVSPSLATQNSQVLILCKVGADVTDGAKIAFKVYESLSSTCSFTEVESFAKTITLAAADANGIIALDLAQVMQPHIKIGYKRTAQNSSIDSILILGQSGRTSIAADTSNMIIAEILPRT